MLEVGEVVFEGESDGVKVRATVTEVVEMGGVVTVEIGDWSSTPSEDPEDPNGFGLWFEGEGVPQWFGDLDGDGHPELIAPVPQADIGPTTFRVFRWTGSALEFLRKGAVFRDVSGKFVWVEEPMFFEDVAWVESLGQEAEVCSFIGQELLRKSAELEIVLKGFVPGK